MQLDEAKIEQMIKDNNKLVHFVINKQFSSLLGDEDIEQCGMIGLWKACKMYDADQSKFSTFATRCIRNEILMELRRRRKFQKLDEVSLDMPIQIEGKEDETSLLEMIHDPNDYYVEVEHNLDFLDDIASGREIEILDMTMRGYSQVEIAKYFKISRSYVSRILSEVRQKVENEWS